MTLRDNLMALLELQQIDTAIQRARRSLIALGSPPAAKAHADTTRKSFEEASVEFHSVSGEYKDSELKLTALEAKLKGYQLRLYQGTVTNPKELANIEREVEALGRQRSGLDGRILELMDIFEEKKSIMAAAEAEALKARQQLDTVVADAKARTEALTIEVADLSKRRVAAVADVEDARLLKRYDDIRQREQGVGIAKIVNNDCGGCHMTLPTILVKQVRDWEEVCICENCRRILVV